MEGILDYCWYCGKSNARTGASYPDRCDECAKRYNRYTTYKTKQKELFSEKREKMLEEIREYYRLQKRRGYKVPRDFM